MLSHLSREGRIAVEGSPPFDFINALIAASGTWIINLESNTEFGTQIYKYVPLDFIEVENDSARDVDLVLNGVLTYRVLANSIRNVTRRPIHQVKIVNRDAVNTIAANLVKVTMERLPATADSQAAQKVRESVR
jgi:hypothetical protein